MPLPTGARLGPYEITGPLGAGGMGEVYRAHDTRLRRDVAVKVLPEAFARDEDRLRRFEQEALATAALNHPNILVVFDVGRAAPSADAAPVAYVVEELLEGRTLGETLAGEALSVRKVVDYAVQVAHGLAAAHARGVVHRDLKPENLFVTTDDRVKILDFGLARTVDVRADSASTMLAGGTEPGVVLGTLGYMAPEQVRGGAVDHRADLFSFGAILYELLTGRRAFGGETAADTMTAILREAPADVADSGRPIPPALARVVDRCLEKNPALRFQSASDLAFALQTLGSDARSGSMIGAAAVEAPRAPAARPWLAAAALVAAGAALGWAGLALVDPPADAPALVVLDVAAPPGYVTGVGSALSPDGASLAFTASDAPGRFQLWLRTLGSGEVRALAGTDDARNPFWSPDGASIGFFAGGHLRVLDVATGRVRVICEASGSRTAGTWNEHGLILFATEATVPIMKVEATGRASPVPLPEAAGLRPSFLPGGRYFLFHGRGPSTGTIRVGDSETGAVTALHAGTARDAKYAAGHLLFVEPPHLMAQPFDAATRTLSGEPVAIAEVGRYPGDTGPTYSVAGSLIAFRRDVRRDRQLVWYARDGRRLGVIDGSGNWRNPAFSPDDTRLAVERDENLGTASDIWIYDIARGTLRAVSSHRTTEQMPVWVGLDRILFRRASATGGAAQLVSRPLDGGAETARSIGNLGTLSGLTPDGRHLITFDLRAGNRDIVVLPLEGDAPPTRFAATASNETQPALSPDGRWLAYVSDELGARDVFVQPFPAGGRRVHVSVDTGGVQPRWRRDGRELFFLTRDGRLMAAAVEATTDPVRFGTPRALFQTTSDGEPGLGTRALYDVTRDGQRFIVAELGVEGAGEPPVTVLVNWTSALRGGGR